MSTAYERLIGNAEHVIPAHDLQARIEGGRRLRVKLGVDPTAREITLGWAVPLRMLRRFQDEGHTAVLIMGDFTARIGDPSGKSETRPQLSVEQVSANAEACVAQLLDILSEDNLEVRGNSEWLEGLDLGDVLKLTSSATVAQMLEREDFSARFKANRPISIIEFMYPLLQGYDSVAIEADVELGGTDQLFNLLMARDLQKAYGQEPQIALTMPLLVGLDGSAKMSQSLGNYVGIRERPEEMFGKLMSIPDHLVRQYASLAAELAAQEVEQLGDAAAAGGPPAAAAKRRVARAVVELYAGREAATGAEAAFDRQFKLHESPEEVAQADIPPGAVKGDLVDLSRALALLGLASSRAEARRLIAQGGVRLDGKTVGAEEVPAAKAGGALLQVGKRRFVRLR
ncbi:MAG TPA: tyrosine--tRNA ligase [Actinomycetota bacterium]|nr:tyrosine--tRNA ligase [Actinomycetota bacterium]